MRVLIFNHQQQSTVSLEKVLRYYGVHSDLCDTQERFNYLSMTEKYLAVIVLCEGGFEWLKGVYSEWKKERCCSLFVVITQNQSSWQRVQALQLGIDYYIIQPFSYTQFIGQLLEQAYLQKEEVKTLKTKHFEIDPLTRSAYYKNALLSLTKTEFELLAFFIRKRGIVLSRVQIWEEIWGYDEYPLANTVDVHINRLRKKFEEGKRLFVTIYGIGYQLTKDA